MLFTLILTGVLAVEPVPIELPSAPGSMAPGLVAHGDDALILSWLEPRGDGNTHFCMSQYAAGEWSAPVTIAARNDFFVNWADVPMVCPIDSDSLSAFWLQKAGPGTYAYHVIGARSDDAGTTWAVSGPIHDDFSATEHGFIAPVPALAPGATRVFWLDGRAMAAGDAPHSHTDHPSGDMQLRTTILHALPMPSEVLDARTCECCNTSAAMTSHGPVVVYRDRSDDEVRDIAIVRQIESAWTAPVRIHDDGWGITACPVNGPAVDASGDHLVVAWYTGVGQSGAVRMKFSDDGGATFGDLIQLDDSFPVGRVAVEMMEDGSAFVCWLDDVGGLPGKRGAVQLQRITAEGTKDDLITAGRTTLGRRTGFPQIEKSGDDLVVIWTEDAQPTRLRGVRIKR